MKLFSKAKDGGPESKVTGYWLVEIKSWFSIVLLRFDEGSRDVYHSHSFNAFSWYLSGEVVESILNGPSLVWKPSLRPKYTSRKHIHKVYAKRRTWVLSFRGPWQQYWLEYNPKTKQQTTLTWGRREL